MFVFYVHGQFLRKTCTGTVHDVRSYCACHRQAPGKSYIRAAYAIRSSRIRHGRKLSVQHTGFGHYLLRTCAST